MNRSIQEELHLFSQVLQKYLSPTELEQLARVEDRTYRNQVAQVIDQDQSNVFLPQELRKMEEIFKRLFIISIHQALSVGTPSVTTLVNKKIPRRV